MNVEFKEGALRPIHPYVWYVIGVVHAVHHGMAPVSDPCVVTSALRDGGGGSLHVLGCAVDFRVRHMAPVTQRRFAFLVERILGDDFDVVLEGPAAIDPKYKDAPAHLHVEWDPR